VEANAREEAHLHWEQQSVASDQQTEARLAQKVSRAGQMTFEDRLRRDLEADEGVVHGIYIDSLGHKTCGIGHLCRPGEPEYDMAAGEEISSARVNELCAADIAQTLRDCEWLFGGWSNLPDEVRLILANMMFNLGLPRLSKFVMLRQAVEDLDWQRAADEMENSRWRKQVPNRSSRLISRMRSLG
jgi:GH24 family phage-related lysozyme (muramidase)